MKEKNNNKVQCAKKCHATSEARLERDFLSVCKCS